MIAHLLVLIAVLNVLDTATTVHLLNLGYQEANPFMRSLIASGVFVHAKMSATALLLAFACIYRKRIERRVGTKVRMLGSAVLMIPLLLLSIAVLNNIAISFFKFSPFEGLICSIYGCATL